MIDLQECSSQFDAVEIADIALFRKFYCLKIKTSYM